MSSPPAPRKPPRGVKYGKDASGSGLLVAVIKTLDASETNEERQQEKLKIEKEFKKTDIILNNLVAKHAGDLTQVMQLFGQVSTSITTSRAKIRTVKENLMTCKQLLRCRREEIQKLYKDTMQQKYSLEMLEQIDELRKVPSKVQSYTNKRHYLHATQVLVKAIDLSNGRLRDVEGLSDLRTDLKNRSNQLYLKMIDELKRHLYQLSTAETLSNFQRQASSIRRSDNNLVSPFQRNVMRRSTERAEANAKIRKALLEMAQGFDVEKTEVIDNSELLDTDLSRSYFIGIIVECFALLRKIPESLEALRTQIQTELLAIVTRTTQHLFAILAAEGSLNQQPLDDQTHPLLELLGLVHKQFKLVANAHTLLLKNYLNVTQRHGVVVKPYDIADYWGQAQAVMQLLLTDYLDIQNVTADDRSNSTFADQTNNINSYFNRRKINSRKTLFKFDKTPQLVHDGPREHRRNASDMSNDEMLNAMSEDRNKGTKTLVCQPDPALIRKIYLPLLSYTQEIEETIKSKPFNAFNDFLNTHIKEIFLAKGHNRNLQLTIDSLAKNHDAWRAIISPEEMKSMGLTRPLLQSTVLVEQKITETKSLIQDLPKYSDDLLKTVCSLLKMYRETCQAAYRGIVQPETEDKRIYSVAWLKDEDISRFLKTLPNWTDLKSSRSKVMSNADKKLIKATNMYMTSEEESPTQVQQRNIREAEMLTSNLGESFISHQEILSDISVLKELAILQESMEWFSHRITEFANDLRKPITNRVCTESNNDIDTSITIKDGSIKVLTNLALEFDDLANTCLLVLHLEVRVQCFHYLKSNEKNTKFSKLANDSLEPDSKVLKLTKVLSDMDEALNSTLHPRKTKYIFEGLAHLAARILIMASNAMETIDQASVQRMCRNAIALQQTLSSITATREIALDNARNFYEMLYMDPEEILANILQKGAQFTEMQYLNALQMSCKTKGINDSNTLATYQNQLSDILGTKPSLGVTV